MHQDHDGKCITETDGSCYVSNYLIAFHAADCDVTRKVNGHNPTCNIAPWYAPLTQQERHETFMVLMSGHNHSNRLERFLYDIHASGPARRAMTSEQFDISMEILGAC